MFEIRFKKGDRVQFKATNRMIQGIVKEDRGPIGVKGRHLYLVEFLSDGEYLPPSQAEFPAVEIQLVEDTVVKK